MGDKIVTDLRRDDDLIALVWKRLRDQVLTQSVAISIGRVEERDAEIEGFVHERDCFALGELSPPAGRDRPKTKSNFAHAQVGVFVSAIAHG